MSKEHREYRYSKTAILSWIVIGFMFFILAFVLGFLENDLAFKVPGMCSFLVGFFWIIVSAHAMSTVQLATTEDEIIFSERPLKKPIRIPVKDIVKVKIQMNRYFWPSIIIWYSHLDEISKVRITMSSLRKDDQMEFCSYLEDLARRKTGQPPLLS